MNIPPADRRSPDTPPESPHNSPATPPINQSGASGDARSPASSLSPSPNASRPSSPAPREERLHSIFPALTGDAQQRQRLQLPAQTSRSRRTALDGGLAALSAAPLLDPNSERIIAPLAVMGETENAVEESAQEVTATAAFQPAAALESGANLSANSTPAAYNPVHRRATQIAAPSDLPAAPASRGRLGFAAMLQSQGLALALPPGLSMPTWPTSPGSPDSPGAAPFGLNQASPRGRGQPSNRRTARMIRDLMQPSPLMLADIATQWSNVGDAENTAALHARWNGFSSEGGAQVFSEFLVKLTSTVNADNAAFKKQTADLLAQLKDDPELRQQVFAISVDSTTACEDRVSLAFVTMLAAARAATFRQTSFASDADAITIQRQFHRLDLLHDLAHTIVAETRNGAEELETHLHLLTRHVGTLQLAGTVPEMDMRWDTCAQVSNERDASVAPTIKRQENEQFARWLSHSPSWLDYIEREDKTRFDAMHEARDSMFEQQFQPRLDAQLAATGLSQSADPSAWSDAERVLGKVVTSELIDELHGALTADFLAARGNAHLLAPYWPEQDAVAVTVAAAATSDVAAAADVAADADVAAADVDAATAAASHTN